MIKSSVNFYYAGKRSIDYGIYNVAIDTRPFQEPFIAKRSIKEITTRFNYKPYFQNVVCEPLSFDLSFAILDSWDDIKIREIARWLSPDYYQPLYFEEDINKIYYCMPIDTIDIIHNGLKQGYITLTFRCDAPWAYSQFYVTPVYDYSNNTTGVVLSIDNAGDLPLYPEIWITKVGNGDVGIINQTNGGIEFKFTGLVDGEIVYVDNENEYIETSLSNTYRYANFNNNYLELVVGTNDLFITGACKLQFRYRFKRL